MSAGETNLHAGTQEGFAFPVYRVTGEADAGTNDGDMRTGDKWATGFDEYPICGDDDAL